MSPDVDMETATPVEPTGWTPPATGPEPPPPARRGLGRGVVAAMALTAAGVAMLITALVLTLIHLHNADALSDARATALVAATTFSVDLSTYDYHHLDQDFKVVVDHSTGKFKTNFSKASKDLLPLITKYQATSTGKVVGAGVYDATTDKATVVVFVDQTVHNSNSPTPRVDRNRLVISLIHSGSGWLVNDVEIR